MKERPILFSGAMVRAILEGRKTQTRRVVKPAGLACESAGGVDLWTGFMGWQPADAVLANQGFSTNPQTRCPYGQPGDRLWVRESFFHEPADYCYEASMSTPSQPAHTVYRADMSAETLAFEKRVGVPRDMRWTPSIHMPRKLSRITLEVTGVRVERLQDISEADAIAEGVEPYAIYGGKVASWRGAPNIDAARESARFAYWDLWDSLNAARGYGWDVNPWVWVVEFRRVES